MGRIDLEKILRSQTIYLDGAITNNKPLITFVKKLKASKKAYFIYRGESNLLEHYNADTENILQLCEKIFMVGIKGRQFITSRYQIIDALEFIWQRISEKVCLLAFSSDNTKNHVESFLDMNPDFRSFFLDNRKKNDFLSLKSLPDETKTKIIDYYLSLLHSIGKAGNSFSYFLSSSKKISIAGHFSGNNSNSIIIYGWIPKKGLTHNLYLNKPDTSYIEIINSLGLPEYKTSIYSEQEEICIKYGLLPQYIIGFQHYNNFYVNPAVYKTIHDNVICDGFDIDQSDFLKKLEETKYTKYFIVTDEYRYDMHKTYNTQ